MQPESNLDTLRRILSLQEIFPDEIKLKQLQEKLQFIANQAGAEPVELSAPTKFLRVALTDEQQELTTQILGHEYAKRGVELQDLMMHIPMQESSERMLSIQKLANDAGLPVSLSERPFHNACGDWAGKPRVFWVREDVGTRFIKFLKLAQSIGLRVEVEDAFRPQGVQEGLFLRRIQMILEQNPDWINDWSKVWAEARSKTAVYSVLAGHKSGAAIDVTLYRENGESLNMGNKYPQGGPKVVMDFPLLTQEEWESRQIFKVLAEAAGFVGYPFEDWHFSFGDIAAGVRYSEKSGMSIVESNVAKYGPIKNFDMDTGDIEAEEITDANRTKPFYSQAEIIELLGID